MAKQPPATAEEKLDRIIDLLQQMNGRDRLRMWGATLRGILSLIPLVVFIASLWYIYTYGDQLIEQMAAAAARQASNVAGQNAQNLLNGLDITSLQNLLKSNGQ